MRIDLPKGGLWWGPDELPEGWSFEIEEVSPVEPGAPRAREEDFSVVPEGSFAIRMRAGEDPCSP